MTVTQRAIRSLKMAILVVAMAFATEARAQYDVFFSHYFDMEPSFNPAAIGKDPKLNITAAYAMDLVGFEHNPQTAYISGDMPFVFLNRTHGVGLQFMNDKLGLFNHMRISAQYSYKANMLGGQLGIGVQAGLLSEKFNGSGVELPSTSTDEFMPTADVTGNALDIGAGLYYTLKNFYFGVSATHLTAPTVHLGEKNELKIDRTYYATTGYNIQLRNPLLMVKTSAIGRYDGAAYRVDVTGRLYYTNESKKFYGGLSYSPTNSVTVLFGMNVKGINVGYSYEAYTNGLSLGNGSHELYVGYQMDLNLVKKGKNLHKSVRIL